MLKRLDNFHPLTYKNDKKPEAERKPDTYNLSLPGLGHLQDYSGH